MQKSIRNEQDGTVIVSGNSKTVKYLNKYCGESYIESIKTTEGRIKGILNPLFTDSNPKIKKP
jgi:hypothetical protein